MALEDLRTSARIDSNQPGIVAALRAAGARVQHAHQVGRGFPDLIVGYRGTNYLLEIKDGEKPPSKRQLTRDEKDWHDGWLGSVHVVYNAEDALRAIGAPGVEETTPVK